MKQLIATTILTITATGFGASGQTLSLEQAREAFGHGDYDQAAATLAKSAEAEPKNATLNHQAGVALMRAGDIEQARKYLKRGTEESLLYLARIAVDGYDFDEAEELVERYDDARSKARRKAKGKQPAENPAIYDEVEETLERGRSMIERVEKIVVIDSIAVNKNEFFRAYRLAASAGKIEGTDVLPKGFPAAEPTTVHVTQDGESMIWAVPDSTENYVLAEATRLADGSWEGPVMPSGNLGEGGDVNYPFLMADGMTLYFASDGEGSLGGYDIYISRRDGDGFLQPQNIGMPYNSPFDDYMLAIDEETGTGWWATDRNQLEDMVTIYRFIPSELRVNYPTDTPNLKEMALLTNYKATWEPGADYTALLASPKEENGGRKGDEFRFSLPDGKILTSLQDIPNQRARMLMKSYIELNSELDNLNERLAGLRAEYGKGNRSREGAIRSAEERQKSLREEIARKRNEVVNAMR
ncbi:MAG: tetratricopeptide repeat protein [Paramuribaculum sp.]|nr:tetratricopeptide repeat protein [Paramuribaculum sp.]